MSWFWTNGVIEPRLLPLRIDFKKVSGSELLLPTLSLLEAYRGQARNEKKLDELIGYLRKHQEEIPDYHQCRIHCQFNGSAHVEKANDLLVARRQKHKGMHWSLETSDSLCALKTLMLNHGWELYWQKREVLPLAA